MSRPDTQTSKFKAAARKAGCEMDAGAFDAALGKIVKPPPKPAKKTKPKKKPSR
jgi:hypothetical protein